MGVRGCSLEYGRREVVACSVVLYVSNRQWANFECPCREGAPGASGGFFRLWDGLRPDVNLVGGFPVSAVERLALLLDSSYTDFAFALGGSVWRFGIGPVWQ